MLGHLEASIEQSVMRHSEYMVSENQSINARRKRRKGHEVVPHGATAAERAGAPGDILASDNHICNYPQSHASAINAQMLSQHAGAHQHPATLMAAATAGTQSHPAHGAPMPLSFAECGAAAVTTAGAMAPSAGPTPSAAAAMAPALHFAGQGEPHFQRQIHAPDTLTSAPMAQHLAQQLAVDMVAMGHPAAVPHEAGDSTPIAVNDGAEMSVISSAAAVLTGAEYAVRTELAPNGGGEARQVSPNPSRGQSSDDEGEDGGGNEGAGSGSRGVDGAWN